MSLNINQFAQTPVQGDPDLGFRGSVISCSVSPNQATPLVPGQIVKLDTTINPRSATPAVIGLASASDTSFGVVLRNFKDQNYPANARVEIGCDATVVYMTADTANFTILPAGAVEADIGNNTVLASQGINPTIGFALDGVTAAGSLFRVWMRPPVFSTPTQIKTASFTATLAQINAGLILIPGVAGKKITISNVIARVVGAFATGTSVELESSTTAVAVETIAEAALTNGAVLFPTSANVTLGAGFAAALPVGEGVSVANNGSAQTAGTSITYTITYSQA